MILQYSIQQQYAIEIFIKSEETDKKAQKRNSY